MSGTATIRLGFTSVKAWKMILGLGMRVRKNMWQPTANSYRNSNASPYICAIGSMEGARLGGYRVPIDLSVIGYDNLKLCQYTVPKLTSISQNITQKALLATKFLLERIRTGSNKAPIHVKIDVEIVERQSVISLF